MCQVRVCTGAESQPDIEGGDGGGCMGLGERQVPTASLLLATSSLDMFGASGAIASLVGCSLAA